MSYPEAFSKIIEFTLWWETGGDEDGGYTNDPDDPGGETKWGVAKRYNPEVNIKNLTKEDAIELFYKKYWLRFKCDEDPHPINIIVFEIAVNPGAKLLYMVPPGFEWKDLIIWRLDYYMDRIHEQTKKVKYIGGWNDRTMALYFKIMKGEL